MWGTRPGRPAQPGTHCPFPGGGQVPRFEPRSLTAKRTPRFSSLFGNTGPGLGEGEAQLKRLSICVSQRHPSPASSKGWARPGGRAGEQPCVRAGGSVQTEGPRTQLRGPSPRAGPPSPCSDPAAAQELSRGPRRGPEPG